MNKSALHLAASALVAGRGAGKMLFLDEPLSFWGGVNPESGAIVQADHPQYASVLRQRVLVMARAKGSSSSSSVLAELLRNGNGPAAIVMRHADLIVGLGCIVASELYAIDCPLIVLEQAQWNRLAALDRNAGLSVLSGVDASVTEMLRSCVRAQEES